MAKDHRGRERFSFADPKRDRAEREALRERIATMRLGASGMRYFGDYAEADALEAAADALEGR